MEAGYQPCPHFGCSSPAVKEGRRLCPRVSSDTALPYGRAAATIGNSTTTREELLSYSSLPAV